MIPIRYGPFGLANHSGLIVALILLLLLALSNDISLRRLGAARWKSLQRWNYVGAGLLVVHGGLYQIIEKRPWPFIMLFTTTVLVVAALQFAGFRRRRSWKTDATSTRRISDSVDP